MSYLVVVKASEVEKIDFLSEIGMMKQIGCHKHVVNMLACCTLLQPFCMVMEYVPHGDLLKYLRRARKQYELQTGRRVITYTSELNALPSEGKGQAMVPVPVVTIACHNSNSSNSSGTGYPIAHSKDMYLPSHAPNGYIPPYNSTCSEPSRSGSVPATNPISPAPTVSRASSFTPGSRAREEDEWDGVARGARTFHEHMPPPTPLPQHMRGEPVGAEVVLDPKELQSFALQISLGMKHLSDKGVTHRDLAARNVLVGENKVLKISDFGLSREGIYVKTSGGRIPLRWLSVEAMRESIYTSASDIWAFGIVLWEICTLGGFPYPTISDKDLLPYLLRGNRLEKPHNCTDEIYNIMLKCWAYELTERPTFLELCDTLQKMNSEKHPYVNIDPKAKILLPPIDEYCTMKT